MTPTLDTAIAQHLPAANFINPLDDATLTVLRRIATAEEIVIFADVLYRTSCGHGEWWMAEFVWGVVGRLAEGSHYETA